MYAHFMFLPILATLSILARAANTAPLDMSLLLLVKGRLAENSTDSWVSGTRTEALLELEYPTLSVFGASHVGPFGDWVQTPGDTNQIVDGWASQRASDCTQFLCVSGGAAGDPASLGVAWILASVTEPLQSATYKTMIQDELTFLTVTIKRTPDGAISMRPLEEDVQLWNDFVYMVPPFLAYAGAVYSNTSLLQEAYDQCRLYRQYLQDPTTKLWKHIVLGSWDDPTLWGTGNAWAAGGITRTLETLKKSDYPSQFSSQISDLSTWANEIIDATFPFIRSDSLLPNQYDSWALSSTFSDGSSSALLAATVFRLSVMGELKNNNNLQIAESIRESVNAHVDPTTGWLAPVVNPLSWLVQTDQAFVLLLNAAYMDHLIHSQRRMHRSRHHHW